MLTLYIFVGQIDYVVEVNSRALVCCTSARFNLSAPVFFFLILAHPVYKMLIIQDLNTLEL